jgi:hypothetical protein
MHDAELAAACKPERVATHKRLARCLRTVPSVEAVDYLSPSETPSDEAETEIVVEATRHGTVPNSVALKIVASGLGIFDTQPWQTPGYQRLIVR